MSKLLIPGILQQQANAQQGGGGGFTLNFQDVVRTYSGFSEQNNSGDAQTIPENCTLYFSATVNSGSLSVMKLIINGTWTSGDVFYGGSPSKQTYSLSDSDEIYFQWYGTDTFDADIIIRLDDSGGDIVDELNIDFTYESGGCFLTTACVNYMGLPDNGEELNAMRWLRDEYMNIYYKEEIAEYYEFAPLILKAIPKDSYNSVMDEIFETVKQVQHFKSVNDFVSARKVYLELFYRLKNRYL
jgi:hypothetical protein